MRDTHPIHTFGYITHHLQQLYFRSVLHSLHSSITSSSRKISKQTPLVIHSQHFPLITSQFDIPQFVNEIRFSSNPSGYSNQFFPHHSNAKHFASKLHYRFDNRWSCHRAKNRNRNLELGSPLVNFIHRN